MSKETKRGVTTQQEHLENIFAAKNKIPSLMKMEGQKIKLGHKWMYKEKTTKLVSPNNITKNLNYGWKLVI